MDGEASDKTGHKNDEGDAHEQHCPPELRHPLSNGQQGLFVEQQVLEPHQRTLSVNLSAFEKNVAIALKVTTKVRSSAQLLNKLSPLRITDKYFNI